MGQHGRDLLSLGYGELVGPYEEGIERLGYLEYGAISWLYMELLVFKKDYPEWSCFVIWLVGWSVGLSVCRSVGWLVGWLDGWLVCWLVGWMVGWSVGWLVG
jgi:hypothetical protein